MTATPVIYGGFWPRVAALLIDLVVTYVLGFVTGFAASFAVAFLATVISGEKSPGASAMTIGYVVQFLVDWLYFALLESSVRGATLGKRFFGLRVVTDGGQPLSFAHATVRFFAKIVSALLLGIGFVLAAFSERKRALHDMIAGTLVVKS